MLNLDYIQRAKNPLGPILRGKLRWVAAKANGCDYGMRYAEADLKRAGAKPADIKALAGNHRNLPRKERLALAFAKKMTRAAYTVTDAEVADLLTLYGPRNLVAMVHTLAYANFQDRVLLALGAEVEPGGPLPPLEVEFDSKQLAKIKAPTRPPWKDIKGAKDAAIQSRPEWQRRSFAELQKSLAGQKIRKPRIPLPTGPMSKPPPKSKPPAKNQPAKKQPTKKPPRPPADRVEHGQHGIRAGADPCLVQLHVDVSSGSFTRSRVLQQFVLGDYAQQRMLLLNGAQRNAARGRGPQ